MCARHVDGLSVICDSMMNDKMCIECPKWKEKQNEVLSQCESIFDAVEEMERFERECLKNCSFPNNS